MRRGTRVGQAYVAVTADGDGINEEIVDAVDEAGKDIDDKGEDHGERYGEGFSEGFLTRVRGRLSNRLSQTLSSRDVAGRAGDEAGESFVEKMSDKVKDLGDKIGAELSDRLASNPEQVRRGIDRAFDDDFIDRIGERLGTRLAASMTDAIDRQGASISAAIAEAVSGNAGGRGRRGAEEGLGGLIGRAFGAGARNNALNLLGRSIGSIVSLTERAGKFAVGFADGLKKAGDSASILSRLMSGLAGGGAASGITSLLSRIASAGPIAVVALGAVLLSFSALASVVGALIGLVTALAATITSALVGALAVVGPLLGAITVAGGLVAVAFTSMTNAQKDYLFSAFQPFKAALTGIGQIIMREFVAPLYNGQSAIQVWSANLQKALLPVAAVASLTARAFADAGNTITASLSGPGFQRFFAVLGSELPTIVRNLSSALGNFLNGIAGTFAAILPYVTQFSRYLRDVAARFSDFANSARGQNSISDFVGRALESLKSLWRFVKQFAGLIADVFFNPASQRAGNSIFDRLANAFRGFRDSFNKAVRDGSVERWFNDAIKFGSALWSVIKALADIFFALYNSGVLTGVGQALQGLATIMSGLSSVVTPLIDALGRGIPGALGVIPSAVQAALGPLGHLWNIIKNINNAIRELAGGSASTTSGSPPITTSPGGIVGPWAPGTAGNPMPYIAPIQLPELGNLISSGNTALNNTYESMGGYMPDPDPPKPPKDKKKKEWENPYIEFANSFIRRAPTLAEEIRKSAREAGKMLQSALRDANRLLRDLISDTNPAFASGIRDAAQSLDAGAVAESLRTMMNAATESANAAVQSAYDSASSVVADAQGQRDSMVSAAESAVQNAAQALASATNKKDAKAALKALQQARRDLELAKRQGQGLISDAQLVAAQMRDGAEAARDRIQAANRILETHSIVTPQNVADLVNGMGSEIASLADYAEARGQVAEKLAATTEQLTSALALRDNYASQVTDSIRAFGAITTAQAQVINGVAQSLTFTDITSNLRDRLDRIKKFNENLRQLIALGISDAAYKQIVDAGVDTGGAYAEAILQGGQGAVSEVNDLVKQIDDAASLLGDAAATQMYQAGVDAAQGIVDGLLSLSNQLTTAATALGNSIAAAIASALGIASPSRVLRAMMSDVGDGAALGLDDQQPKVSAAAARLSEQIRVSPEVARYAAEQGASPTTDPVSGNSADPRFRDLNLTIQTPTEDPHAVAVEAVNELTGRL